MHASIEKIVIVYVSKQILLKINKLYPKKWGKEKSKDPCKVVSL
jgi:hypothetical protein